MSDRLPGVITKVETNQTLTSGITSIRKPVILGVGDYKVLVTNEKVIRGSELGGTDTLANTIYGQSTPDFEANVIRIGNSPNSSDYSKTNNFTIDANGKIDWSPGAETEYPTTGWTEPARGQEYYVTYYKKLNTFELIEYTSERDVLSTHGSEKLAAYDQYATATPVSSANTTTFTWTNSEGWSSSNVITTASDWTATFTSGANTNISRALSTYSSTSSGGTFTVAVAFPNAIVTGDVFRIAHSSPKINTLTTGALLSLKNGAQSVIVGQLDNSGFTSPTAPTSGQYGSALDTHLTSLRGNTETPLYIVPMLPDNTTTFYSGTVSIYNSNIQTYAINPVWEHCKLMSSPENKGERTCVAGFAPTTTIANFKSFGSSYFSQRMIIMAPGDVAYTVVSGTRAINGSLAAAAWAGKWCSRVNFTSMLRESLTGISMTTNFYNVIEQRELTAKGISFLISDAGIIRVVASKTTDVSTADTEDPAIVSIADHIKKITREDMDRTFTGAAITDRLISAMTGKMTSIFEQAIYAGVITAYKDITVRQNLQEPRLIEVGAAVRPTYSLWWTDITVGFYV